MDDTAREEQAGFWDHVGVLRGYVLLGGCLYASVAGLSFFYGNDALIAILLKPMQGHTLLFLSPLGPFLFKIRISLYFALLVAFPFWLALIFRFVSPALPKGSRVVLSLFVVSSAALGAASLLVTYFYFLPTTLAVLQGFVVTNTQLLLTADSYLSFAVLELLVTFVILQIPVVIVALAYVGLLDPRVLAKHRKVVIVILVTLLAILTPTTDVVTLITVSIPAILLTEAGILIATLVYNRRKQLRKVATSPPS
jgi:sec-independent protein translocase protein TatC